MSLITYPDDVGKIIEFYRDRGVGHEETLYVLASMTLEIQALPDSPVREDLIKKRNQIEHEARYGSMPQYWWEYVLAYASGAFVGAGGQLYNSVRITPGQKEFIQAVKGDLLGVIDPIVPGKRTAGVIENIVKFGALGLLAYSLAPVIKTFFSNNKGVTRG